VRPSWGADFGQYLVQNVLATQRLLEAARGSRRLQRLVFASSSSVYGQARDLPLREESLPQPYSPYGVSKLAAEHLCLLYHHNFGVPAVALRYFTVYGPRQRPDMGFRRFIQAALEDQPIPVYGDGEQTRDFTYVADAIEANVLALAAPVAGQIFNIGGGSRVSVNEILRTLEAVMGRALRREPHPEQPGDMRHTWADTTRARDLLGFAPRISLRAGLERQVAWARRLGAD
jgi:UDP-glucose 4-epimerase